MTRTIATTAALLCSLASAPLSAQSRWPTKAGDDPKDLGAVTPQCRSRTPLITSDSIGPFSLHQTLREIERACPRLQYGWGWSMGNGPLVRATLGEIAVQIDIRDTLPSSAVYQISTDGPEARTADGFGPGSTLSD